MTCLFIHLTEFFTEQKVLILVKLNISIFTFLDHAFGGGIYLTPNHQTQTAVDFLLCFLLEVL